MKPFTYDSDVRDYLLSINDMVAFFNNVTGKFENKSVKIIECFYSDDKTNRRMCTIEIQFVVEGNMNTFQWVNHRAKDFSCSNIQINKL
jgi:hypothetical protein